MREVVFLIFLSSPDNMPHLLRARFASDIITEFLPSKKPSNKVIVLCSGMPGMPSAKKAMRYIAKKGYWVFLPRYRGTWESGGTFLDHSPHEDILDVVDGLSRPFISIWDGVEYRIEDPEVDIIGASFGGSAAILCSMDERVKKAVAFAPVVDWVSMQNSETEPLDWLGGAVKDAFGEAYRFSLENWEGLSNGEFYNPVDHVNKIDPGKVMIVHTKDDDVVLYEPVEKFASKVGCQLITLKKGGHIGSSALMRWGVRRRVWKFLEKNI
jgi:dipeptidyl aminopeptidase/acylaminoacyl peptidase